VILDWDQNPDWEGRDNYFPEDLRTRDAAGSEKSLWAQPALRDRMSRMIERLGRVWDTDPRVAWVQSGMIGWWGEQEQPGEGSYANNTFVPLIHVGNWIQLLGNNFTESFKRKNVLVRNSNDWSGYQVGTYWDSFAHPEQTGVYNSIRAMNYNSSELYKKSVVEGETAYNWGVFPDTYGGSPIETLGNLARTPNGNTYLEWEPEHYRNFNYYYNPGENHADKLIDRIRDLHCSALGWVSNWSLDRTELAKYWVEASRVKENADRVHNAFGYRFVISSFSCTRNPVPGNNMTVTFSVENRGSAPILEDWPWRFSSSIPPTGRSVGRQHSMA
jgi:hypothetical protein